MHKILIDDVEYVFRGRQEYYSFASRQKNNALNNAFLEIGSVCDEKCLVNNQIHNISSIGIAIKLGKWLPFVVQMENGEVYNSCDVSIKHSSGVIIPLRGYLRAVGRGYLK